VLQSLRLAHRAYVPINTCVVMEGKGSALLNDPKVKESYLEL
jgi:ABC-type lipopolysaccharide export system ATPase subunit